MKHSQWMRDIFMVIGLAGLLGLLGCGGQPGNAGPSTQEPKANPPGPVAPTPAGIRDVKTKVEKPITKAQPKLPTKNLLLGPGELKVVAEVADTLESRAAGLMFRKALGKDEGMIFVFAAPQKVAFYMRNTTVELSAAYIGRTGRIIEIHKLEPLVETEVASNTHFIQFVLEMPRGWFKKNGVRIGHRVKTVEGELDKVLLKP